MSLHYSSRSLFSKLLGTTLLTSMIMASNSAQAVPAFARQTGMECKACHVGSFGPQLTNFGRQFKLNGYVWGDAKNPTKGLSAMVYGGMEHTKKDLRKGVELTDNQERLNTNNNTTVDQASLFYAGRLTENAGMFSQFTYSQPDQALGWDNVDMRIAESGTVGGKSIVYGLSLNNNPSVQDVWQTVPAWRFPYLASGVAPTPDAAPYIGSLAQTVAGLGGYTLWNDLVYAEISGYHSLPSNFQRTMGIKGSPESDHLDGISPYWRMALQHDFGSHYASIGTYGLDAKRFPGNDRTHGSDNILDYGLDATYQFHSEDEKHNVSVYGSLLHERQSLNSTFAAGGSANAKNSLNEFAVNGSYYFDNTYGVTLGRFSTTGSSDALLYADPSNHKPDSAGWTMQLDFTPFGKEKSVLYPNFNNRFFIQYVAYDKFNGLKNNYDGNGRNASDNNTIYFGDWIAF